MSNAKQIPILFSTPMVLAILESRKRMTRRVIAGNPAKVFWDPIVVNGYAGFRDEHGRPVKCPYGQEGDVLYVRESYYQRGWWQEVPGVRTKGGRMKWEFVPAVGEILFEAPVEYRKGRHHHDPYTTAWHKRLARFMPKKYSRIWLKVTGVRVERLQDIGEEDAVAEGVESNECATNVGCPSSLCKERCCGAGEYHNYHSVDLPPAYSAKESFQTLWEKINGDESWKANPWVWVVEFEVLSTTGKPEGI